MDIEKELEGITLTDENKALLASNTELAGLLLKFRDEKRNANKEAKTYRTEKEQISAKLQEIEDAKKQAEEKALAEQGQFKELYERQTQELERQRELLKQTTIDNAVALKATQKGILKTDYLKLLDKSSLIINDKNEVEGLDAVFDTFYKENQNLFKPETVNTNQTAKVDSSLPPQASAGSQSGSLGADVDFFATLAGKQLGIVK